MSTPKTIALKHGERSHYANGGSVIERRKHCPGSLFAEKDLPDTTNEDAEKGTRIHELIEELTPFVMDNWSKLGENKAFDKIPEMLHADRDEVEAAKVACLDLIEQIKKYGGHIDNVKWISETKFIIDESLELGGTVDFAWGYELKGKRYIHAWDYKNGRSPVNCKTTMQLPQYLAAIQLNIGKKKPFDFLYGHIFQPNSSREDLNTEPAIYTAAEIQEKLEEQKKIAKAAFDPKAPRRAGSHCHWCKDKTGCGEHHRWLKDEALYILDAHDNNQALVNLPPVKAAELIQRKPAPDVIIKNLTDDQIRNFVLHGDYIRGTLKAAEEYVKNRAAAGNPVPGLKCVPKGGRRGWKKTLSPAEIGEGLKKLGIQKPWIKEVRNIGDIETELKTLGHKGKDTAKKLIDHLVDKGTPGIDIVPDDDSDSRTAVEVVTLQNVNQLLDANPINNAK